MLNIQLCQKMLMRVLENFFWRLKRDRILEIEYFLVQTWDKIICPVIGTVHCDTVGSLTGPDNFILLFK